MDSQRYSFYIPAIGDMTENALKEIFWNEYVGKVKRVDYFENTKGWYAFVHFEYWLEKSHYIWSQINKYGSYKLWFNRKEYLILRKMTCREIPETSMNIHQIAAKIQELEKRLSLHFNLLFKLIAKVNHRTNNNNNHSHSNSTGVIDLSAKIDESVGELDTGMILNESSSYENSDSDNSDNSNNSNKSYDCGYDYTYSYNYDDRMKNMVDSLVGPRWTDEDDIHSHSNVFVVPENEDDSDSQT